MTIEDGGSTRLIFDVVERIGQIATDKTLTGVMLDYNVDVPSAVPAERIAQPTFRPKRWPQITQAVEEQKRAKLRRPPVSAARTVTAGLPHAQL